MSVPICVQWFMYHLHGVFDLLLGVIGRLRSAIEDRSEHFI